MARIVTKKGSELRIGDRVEWGKIVKISPYSRGAFKGLLLVVFTEGEASILHEDSTYNVR